MLEDKRGPPELQGVHDAAAASIDLAGGVRVFLLAPVPEEKLRGFASVLAGSRERVVASAICGVLGVGDFRAGSFQWVRLSAVIR
jgi:hypothetical protein